MTTRFTTESGSVYEVDLNDSRYRKIKMTEESAVGEFPWRKFLTMRSSAAAGAPFLDDVTIRLDHQYHFSSLDTWSITSPVVSVEEIA